ncbi:D-Ala-D-Ala carboxypeptidase family metallohydrolase [Parerythrobacter aestuarii]|uniref:D-Ala-D-Ala carboxypeptidase family metallohydrolase n=1 Tax=Parerythrobacter aestuarii TaxID=3020909 RepID=UPI0024DE72D6|nr:D-Ala-D-Ala carboxypeptidase family metallohydrolase [Parerythrobacter aestuarii]
MVRRLLVIALGLLLLSAGAWLVLGKGPLVPGGGNAGSYSHDAFDSWLREDPNRAEQFAELVHYLDREQVGHVVPVWQLTRTDNNPNRSCKRPQFLIPPREDWANMVPALKLVRDHVVPELGPLEVASSYRTKAFNECIGGASQSRHLSFSAVDLVAVEPIDNRDLFGRLCAIHKRLGPTSRMGLGAYFDPDDPEKASGRFHIDATGYRSWGYSKRSESSGCHSFG